MGFSRLRFILVLAFFAASTQSQIPLVQGQDEKVETQEAETKQQSEKPKSLRQLDFEAVDENGDGDISTEEMRSYLEKKYLDKWIKNIDANGDGEISRRELRSRRQVIAQLVVAEEDAALAARDKERQMRNQARRMKDEPKSSVERANVFYRSQKPAIGDSVETLSAFDESGNEIGFKDLAGKHSVLVFGCLT